MKTGKHAILIITLALLLVLIPATALASSRYAPGEDGTFYTEVLDAAGNPVNDATVVLDLMNSAGVLILDGVSMTYIAGSDGIYKYDFTAPATEGTYIAVATCTEGQATTEVQVSSPSGSAGDIWGEDMTTYTDEDTFGGSYSTNFGGDIMRLILFGFMAIALLALFFWKKSQVAAYGAAGMWLLLGIQAYVVSDSPNPAQIQDTYMGLFWLGVIFTIACMFLPLIMREKPSKDDLYVDEIDEVTGEPIKRESAEERQAREARKERRHQSPEQKALNRLNRTGKL